MKFSIITPSFNQGSFIARTLDSVAGQQGIELEHLVMDGGSRDDTCAILASRGDGVRWVSEPDGGQSAAVNKGLRAASGDIIGWLNSDDIYYPGALRAVADFFAVHPDTEVLYGLANEIDVDDRVIAPYPTEPWNRERLLETCFICQPALFFRRSLLDRHGLLDERLHYCMDYEYWLRLADAGTRPAYLRVTLAGSRTHAQTKTVAGRVAVHSEINQMLKRKYGATTDRWLFNYAHAVVPRPPPHEPRPRLYLPGIVLVSLLAALRWNHRISREMLRTCRDWLKG